MRALRLAVFIAPLVLPAVLLSGCGAAPGSAGATPAPKGPPPEVTTEAIADGRRLYSNGVCVNCHGATGNGTTNGPALSDQTWLHGEGTYTQIVSIITNGFQAGDIMDSLTYRRPMPARGETRLGKKFTDDEIKHIAAYVWSMSHDTSYLTKKEDKTAY